VGQPFQAVVVTGWKAGPTIGIPESGTLRAAATREGDEHRARLAQPFTLRTSDSGH